MKRTSSLMASAAIGTVIAMGLVAGTWLFAGAIGDELTVMRPGRDEAEVLGIATAIPATAVGGTAGLALAFLARRFAQRPAAAFVGACALLLAAYGVFAASAAEDTQTALWLNAIHLAAAAPIVSLLARALRNINPKPKRTTTS